MIFFLQKRTISSSKSLTFFDFLQAFIRRNAMFLHCDTTNSIFLEVRLLSQSTTQMANVWIRVKCERSKNWSSCVTKKSKLLFYSIQRTSHQLIIGKQSFNFTNILNLGHRTFVYTTRFGFHKKKIHKSTLLVYSSDRVEIHLRHWSRR